MLQSTYEDNLSPPRLIKIVDMKYRIHFFGDTDVVLPVQYKHIIQAAFLRWLNDDKLSDFLHEDGYHAGKRTYKLFTLSDIMTKGEKQQGKLRFQQGIDLIVSAYTSDMDDAIVEAIESENTFRLGSQHLYAYDYEEIEEVNRDCVVDTLSPITVHSTFELPGGTKKTYYYSAVEKEFSDAIRANIIRKYVSIYGVEPQDSRFDIRPLEANKLRKIIVNYKSITIVGWKGKFLISGNPELIRIALLCGLGARNSIGMGAILQKKLR